MKLIAKYENFCVWESYDSKGEIKYSLAPNSCGFPLMPLSKETYENQMIALHMGGLIYGMTPRDFQMGKIFET